MATSGIYLSDRVPSQVQVVLPKKIPAIDLREDLISRSTVVT